MNESEKELYQAVHAMTFADVRNELQLHSLPITGTRTSCTQRLFKYKRQQLATESTSKVNPSKRMITRQAAKAQAELATVVRRTRSIKYTKRTYIYNYQANMLFCLYV